MMFKKLPRILAGAFLLCLILPGLSSAGDTIVQLTVSPDSYTGICPVVLTFRGKITMSEPGDITFKFLRSDGASSKERLMSFTEPGQKEITATWTLSGSYSGWMAIKVLSPQAIESERAESKVVCQTGLHPAGRMIAKKEVLAPQPLVAMKKSAVTTPSVLVPGLVIGLRHSKNQKDDPFTIPQLGISLPVVRQRDRCPEDFCIEEDFLCWIVPCSPNGNPEDWKLPQAIAVGLKHSETNWYTNPLISVFGYDPVEGPDLLPGGGFKKMFGGDIGAPANRGYYWYETTGEGFTDWSLANQLPRGTVIGLKHTRNQPIKMLVWNGQTYDPADSRINPPPGFVRKFGGDIGASSGQGFYWYEKITDR